MSKLREAAEQALENLCGATLCEINSMSSRSEMIRLIEKAKAALREALAEPEQKWKPCRHCGFEYRPPKDNKWHPLGQPQESEVEE